MFELRDPIHKRIAFDEFERRVIDHPFFQRLRFVSQLSFLESYVYPGGVHDRFTHGLGAMHVAGRLFGRLVVSSEVLVSRLTAEEIEALRRRVRLAGLLHDIGHGPFSHASETVFPAWDALPLDRTWWKSPPDRQSKHEDYSVLLIQTLAQEGILESSLAQDVASLVHDGVSPSSWFHVLEAKAPTLQKILKSLISGEMDADRMDYLLRDSYYCGVAYGQYDIDWLISSLSVVEDNGSPMLTISENGVRAFEDMLLARYHMIDQVYFHKTKAGFTHYLEEAIREREISLAIPTDPYAYAELRDGRVIELLFEAAKDTKNYWSYHLMRREPARRVLRFQETGEDRQGLSELSLFCDRERITWFTHSVKGQLTQYGEGTDSTGMIHVAKKTLDGVLYVPIWQYSDLLRTYDARIRFTDFFVRREDAERFEQKRKTLPVRKRT